MPKFCDVCKEVYKDFADSCSKCDVELKSISMEEVRSVSEAQEIAAEQKTKKSSVTALGWTFIALGLMGLPLSAFWIPRMAIGIGILKRKKGMLRAAVVLGWIKVVVCIVSFVFLLYLKFIVFPQAEKSGVEIIMIAFFLEQKALSVSPFLGLVIELIISVGVLEWSSGIAAKEELIN